jgi:hypothetical protein
MAWLTALIEGQQSPEAQTREHQYLPTAMLDTDVRLKILQVIHELDHTVKMRKKYP